MVVVKLEGRVGWCVCVCVCVCVCGCQYEYDWRMMRLGRDYSY